MPGVCPRCNCDVYFAEERLAFGKVWHTFCFSCCKCQKLLDSCNVATHRGELFCKNCYARSFSITTLTSSLHAISSISPKIIANSELIPTQIICELLSGCDCYCCCSDSNVIFKNSSNQRENIHCENKRLRGGGVNEQEKKDYVESENTDINNGRTIIACKTTSNPITWYNQQYSTFKRPFNYQASTKLRFFRRGTTPAVELHAAAVNNKVDNRETINKSYPLSRKSQQQDRSRGHQESLEQTQSLLHEKQQQRDQTQNAVQSIKDSDFSKGMSSNQNQLSIYIRNCLHHNRERPNEIELRIVSTDISSTGENRTRVTLSTCKSPSSRESRITVSPDISSTRQKCSCQPLTVASRSPCVPSRRRVSFSDAVNHDRRTIMQNDLTTSSCRDNGDKPNNSEREIFYDIWQADDVASRSDDGYEDAPRTGNYSENRVSDCTSNKGRDSPENIDGTVANDGRTRNEGGSKSDVRSGDRTAKNTTTRVDEDDAMSNEDASNFYKDVDSIAHTHDEYRMRGGCGGCCGAPSNTDDTTSGRGSVRRSSQDHNCGGSCCCRCCCCCGRRRLVEANESCASEPGRYDDSNGVKTVCPAIATACTVPSLRCCCCATQGCRRVGVCKKAARCGEVPACTTGARSCGNVGCCGGGCRGGKPVQICTPSSSRSCSTTPARNRPQSSRGRSPCARPRCPARSPCPPVDLISGRSPACRSCCGGGGGYECVSPKCRPTLGCCINDGAKCVTDGVCCRLKLPVVCECLGGGLDCRRCGRKVYQAEMQIASGVPYHSICFSCFCCRKPLEPLTYQENCGEIYCKQCYVRNFGPQGYGYGVGAGVLQTPM